MSKILKNKKANSKRWNSENVLYLMYLFFLIKIQKFSDKIYNPYNKAPQKSLEFFNKFG